MKGNQEKVWGYHNPVEIYFGRGQLLCIPSLVGKAKTVLITTPGFSKRGVVDLLKKSLNTSLVGVFDNVKVNPTFTTVKDAFRTLKSLDYDLILALGGGSSIDTAKAVAAIGAAGSEEWINMHLKEGTPCPEGFITKPIIAIPTTAGSGSEVTMWATIWDMENKKKYSLAHQSFYPRQAVLDPELTLTLSEQGTVSSGLDALSHAMEAIWNKNHNPVSDTLAGEAIRLVYNYLPLLKKDLENIELRTNLLEASLFAGLAFSKTQTALAHSISYPLTAIFGIPHGLACALSLPHLVSYNGKDHPERLERIASGLNSGPAPEEIRDCLNRFFDRLEVSLHLSDYGVTPEHIEPICRDVMRSSRAGNNIAVVSEESVLATIRNMM